MIETYDAIIFGCGEGGKCMAWHLAKTDLRTAVVEQRYVGGSCPNIACLPSKNIIHSAGIAASVRAAAAYGTHAPSFTVSMAEVQARKRTMVDGLVAMHHRKFKESGAELVMGWGTLTAGRTIEVTLNDGGTRTLRAEKLFLDLGAFATLPNLPGLADADAMDPCRTARHGHPARAPPHPGRRLYRVGIRPGHAPPRRRRHRLRAGRAPADARRPGHRRRRHRPAGQRRHHHRHRRRHPACLRPQRRRRHPARSWPRDHRHPPPGRPRQNPQHQGDRPGQGRRRPSPQPATSR